MQHLSESERIVLDRAKSLTSSLSASHKLPKPLAKAAAERLTAAHFSGPRVMHNPGFGTQLVPVVVAPDLRRGLPLQDHTRDVIFASYAIEHFDCLGLVNLGGTGGIAAPNFEALTQANLAPYEAIPRVEPEPDAS